MIAQAKHLGKDRAPLTGTLGDHDKKFAALLISASTPHILAVAYRLKVVRIDTRRDVAKMIYDLPMHQSTILKDLIGKSVRWHRRRPKPEKPIAQLVLRRRPQPARISLIDFRPEAGHVLV